MSVLVKLHCRDGTHAKAHRTRQRSHQSRSKLGDKGGLIKTDTRLIAAQFILKFWQLNQVQETMTVLILSMLPFPML
jgi:hypothetical protein